MKRGIFSSACLLLFLLVTQVHCGQVKKGERFSLNHPKVFQELSSAVGQYYDQPMLGKYYENECTRFLQNITNYFLVNSDTLTTMYRNSGKDYNDLGRYEDCIELDDFRYILASIQNAFPVTLSLGLCVPSICSVFDLNTFKPYLVVGINKIIPELIGGIKGFDANKQLETENLVFKESKEENEKATKFNGGALVTIIIILFFSLMVMLSSLYVWYQNIRLQKLEAKRIARQIRRLSGRSNSSSKRQEGVVKKKKGKNQEIKKVSSKKRENPTSGLTYQIARCFSLQESMQKLFQKRSRPDDSSLDVLNGVRVLTLAGIILGNTYLYILKGSLQNLEVIEEWMGAYLFTIVIAAELAVDIFFWMTAFLGCYLLLCTMNDKDGQAGSILKFYLNRYMRLIPLYLFTLLFFWKFIVLFGGEGPMFFMYDTTHDCSQNWIWHLLFLNNLIPWQTRDNCMNWTWYLANDMQFYLLIPIFARLFYSRRKAFYVFISLTAFVCLIIQMSVILVETLSASYFTYKDEYWTVYYVKPYSRLPVFLIGVLAGCTYYSYQRENPGTMRLATTLQRIQESNLISAIYIIIGTAATWMMVLLMKIINNRPDDVPEYWNVIYLMFSRPIFITGFTICIMPIIVGSKICKPMRAFLSHEFWVPFSRLTYGAFLSHGVFMVFRQYNQERGQWGCAFDAVLFFLGFITFSYIFSFLIGMIIEMPCAQLWHQFMIQQQKKKEDAFSNTQSAKSAKRAADSISKQKLLEAEDEDDEEPSLYSNEQISRKSSIETEDLEDIYQTQNNDDNGLNANEEENPYEQARKSLVFNGHSINN